MGNDTTTLQQTMFAEISEEQIFKQAYAYSLDYLKDVFERHVFPKEDALNLLDNFREPMPKDGVSAAETIFTIHQYGNPNTVSQLGGRYFGYVNGGALPVTLAAKQLATFYDQNSAMKVMSPFAATLEEVVTEWLIELFNLPRNTVAGFISGTATANLCGLAAARHRILTNLGWDLRKKGLNGAPRLRVVTGKEIHAAVLKALSILGIGLNTIEWVPVDSQGRIRIEDMPEIDSSTIIILQAGNVNSGSFDDFDKVCDIARGKDAWVHIDGAFGLWAKATTKLKDLAKGMEKANSWSVDAHKTLNVPYDSGITLCSDPEALGSALTMLGAYISSGNEREGLYFTPEMSRRARIIELWAALKYLGKTGVENLVTGLNERALQFSHEIAEIDGFHVLNEVFFNQVIVCGETDVITEKVLAKVQESRECWAGSSIWKGRKVIRVSVCSWATTGKDITLSVQSFKKALHAVTM
ncbi:pyridoxal phosphate-dependent decarboxylase family protein [Flagellimonas sp. S174]|uniref:pyridoxal phosphate-dependent decarboxylase family protein n=1 Tax=Flagellimonas sp. S174 TaxID=3410790 RepID=UPI003BF5C1AD